MDIRSVDLNLLVIFDALARLRTLFDDPLFVRAGSQMEPTPRAQALAPVVRRVVQAIETEVLQPVGFDPSTSERSFTILTPDIGEVAFLPGVLRRLRLEAPGVHLQSISRPRSAAAEALEKGEADLAVGFFPDLQKANHFQQALFNTSYECLACARNAEIGERLTMKQYLAARHIVVRPDGREHLLDRYLDAKGWRRKVTIELSHFMSLVALLPGSDLIATVPNDIATVASRLVPLRSVGLPFKPPRLQVQQFWHRRLHSDAASRWLRGVFHEVNRRDEGVRLPV